MLLWFVVYYYYYYYYSDTSVLMVKCLVYLPVIKIIQVVD